MKTPLAWFNLLHNRVRTAVAVAGVTFAIVLMFMQLGFLEAVKASATIIYDVLEFDICLRSTDYLHLADARALPRIRLYQAQSVQGVSRVVPFQVALAPWRHPLSGEKRAILTMGVRPADDLFREPAIQQAVRRHLVVPDAVLIDTKTRPEYGPKDTRCFGDRDRDVVTELGDRRVRIAGYFTRGAGLSASGAVLISEPGFFRVAPGRTFGDVNFALVRIQPHARLGEVIARLDEALPDDVEVLSRAETIRQELDRWVYQTNYGLIFLTGVAVAVIVGTAIVYQVLSSEVASLLPEYATLKAMGYPNRYLAGIVLQQAVCLALLGFVPGLGLSKLMYTVTATGAGIPIRLTWANFWLVLGLSLAMCVVSGILAMRKTFKADPADLF